MKYESNLMAGRTGPHDHVVKILAEAVRTKKPKGVESRSHQGSSRVLPGDINSGSGFHLRRTRIPWPFKEESRTKKWKRVGLLAICALVLMASSPAKPKWRMKADYVEACSCHLFCQCYFNKARRTPPMRVQYGSEGPGRTVRQH